jgi:hypothetical protein
MNDLRPLIDRIRSLLDDQAADPGGALTDVEHMLTDGYALALGLERERLRLERRIAELARTVDGPAQAEELRSLAGRLVVAEADLAELRALLADLRHRADSFAA